MYMLTPEKPCQVVWKCLCFQDIQSLYAVADNDDQTDVSEPIGMHVQTVMLIGG